MPRIQFDWETGDDASALLPARDNREEDIPSGDTEQAAVPPDASRSRRNRRAMLLIALALFLIAAGAILAINKRIDDTARPIEKDVLFAHRTVQLAIQQGDSSLFASLLAERTWSWGVAQQDLFVRGLLGDRSPWGLQAQSMDPVKTEVHLAPSLTQAEVVSERVYIAPTGNGQKDTLHLRQTSVYRFEDDRWLFAPSDEDFWGEQLTHAGRFLTLTFPERDEAIARRLAGDLDATLEAVCRALTDALCPLQHVTVRLDSAVTSLKDVFAGQSDPFFGIGQSSPGKLINLPTPTLVGLPLDDDGYRALVQGYAAQIAQAMMFSSGIASQGDWQLARFYQGLLNRELIRQGLRPWPLIEDVHVLNPSPIPLPAQDVGVYCVEGIETGGDLYRYDLATGTWSMEIADRALLGVVELPGGDSLILQERIASNDGPRTQLTLRRDGVDRALVDEPPETTFSSLGGIDPTGRYLVVTFSNQLGSFQVTYGLLDLRSCPNGGCEAQPLPDWPAWSPDGSQMIVNATGPGSGGALVRADARGQQITPIGQGYAPFWLDDRTYGFVRPALPDPDLPSAVELVIAATDDDVPHVVLSSQDLSETLPDAARSRQFYWLYALSHPSDANTLLIIAYSFDGSDPASTSRAHVFSFDRRSNTLALQGEVSGLGSSISSSPDGRWLVTDARDWSDFAGLLRFEDLDERWVVSFAIPAYGPGRHFDSWAGWSDDDEWFLLLSDGILHLAAPAHSYHQAIVPPAPGCVYATWLNRE